MTELEDKLRANKIAILKQAEQTAKKEKTQKLQQAKIQEENSKLLQQEQNQQQGLSEKEKLDQARKSVSAKHDAEITRLQKEKQQSLDETHAEFWRPGGGRSQGQSRTQLSITQSNTTKHYDTKIETVQRARNTALNHFEFQRKYPGVVLEGSVSRTFQKSGGQTSLISIYEKQVRERKTATENKNKASIRNAQSNTIIERVKLEKINKEFTEKRIQNDSKKAPNPIAGLSKTTATKTRPKILPSSYFAKSEKTPVSIFGTTAKQSSQAVKTFEETEFQQQKLFKAVTGAKDYKQAIKLKERFIENNPYVGTANSLIYKGGIVDSAGVLIEKKLNTEKIIPYEPIVPPELLTEKPELKTDVIPSQNVPRPTVEKSYYVPGSFDHIFQTDNKKQRLQNEIEIAGGTYGDYLKTLDKNTLDYQLKQTGLGIKRGLTSYTALVGHEVIPTKTHGKSLIDLAFDDIYNSVYEPIIKPNKSLLENLGVKVAPAPANPEPFETTVKTFNQRSPAENFGDVLTVATVETTIALGTAGVGNLAVKGISRLPYLLKSKPQEITQVIKTAEKESKLATVTLEDGTKVKLQNFDYAEPVKPRSKKNIKPAPGIPLKQIKLGDKKITVFDYDAIPKEVKSTTTKRPSKTIKEKLINSKPGRAIGTTFPSTEKLSNLLSKVDLPKEFDPVKSIETKIINTKVVRKIATSKKLTRETDTGKEPIESGQKYNNANNDNFPALPKPNQTTQALKEEQKQILKNLETKSTTKTTNTTKSNTTKKKNNDVVIVEDIILHKDRPQIVKPGKILESLIDSETITEQLTGIKSKSTTKLEEQTDITLKSLQDQKSNLAQKLKDKNKTGQKLKDSYSLIVTPGKQGTQQELKQIITPKPRSLLREKLIQETKSPQKTIKIRPVPGIRIQTVADKKNKTRKTRKRKGSIKYSTWNVDIEKIGTLKGRELDVSGTEDVFKKLDERQRKAHSKTTKKNSKKTTKKNPKKKTAKKSTKKSKSRKKKTSKKR